MKQYKTGIALVLALTAPMALAVARHRALAEKRSPGQTPASGSWLAKRRVGLNSGFSCSARRFVS